MKFGSETGTGATNMSPPVAIMVTRMKRLPRQHRIAHLRALIRRQPIGSARADELFASLRDEISSLHNAAAVATRKTVAG
jgi:hypothetical protein